MIKYSNDFTGFQTGDVLLFRPTTIAGRAAALLSWSRYSHAAMIDISDSAAYVLDVNGFTNGRRVLLADYVRESPIKAEIYRYTKDETAGFYAAIAMRDIVTRPYGWWHILTSWLAWLLPFVRRRECTKHAPFCSEAVAQAYRLGAEIDLVPSRSDRFTMPKHLAESDFLERVGVASVR